MPCVLLPKRREAEGANFDGLHGYEGRHFGHYLSRFYNLPELKFLSVHRCRGFRDAELAIMTKLCPRLWEVDLYGNEELTEQGFLSMVEKGCVGLVEVNLGECVNLTDDVVSLMARRQEESLHVLSLGGCDKVTDKSLWSFAAFYRALEDLDISRYAVTDDRVATLVSSMMLDLRVLSLSRCPMISEECVCHLNKLVSSLDGLDLQHCSSISGHAIADLRNSMWCCDILY
ncbi:EIN3-binding F-box protein 1-like [Wolffia australiana]